MPEDFSFIQITDHHLGPSATSVRLGYAVNYTFTQTLQHLAQYAAPQADFLISTGDLVDPPTPQGYAWLQNELGAAPGSAAFPGPLSMRRPGLEGLPLYLMPGNHDDRRRMCEQFFPLSRPGGMLNASFEHKGVLFLCLDWGADSKARLYPELYNCLDQGLRSGLPLVICMHHQVTSLNMRWMDAFIADEVNAFWEALCAPTTTARILGIIAGHTHISYEKVEYGIPTWGLRSTSYTFHPIDTLAVRLANPQYRLFSIQNGVLTSRLFEVPLPLMDDTAVGEEI
ncbi:MAG TPA: metallophosphoesterase [Anaerolineales bacterium]|nr:metallophosphoesterase [Anaerolineales bacterium]